MRRLLFVLVVVGCGPGSRDGTGAPDAAIVVEPDALACPPPPAAGPEIALAPPFDTYYKAYDLGPVPGVPGPLGGTVISASDNNTLLVAGASERQEGAIYAVGVTRDACGHIVGFSGTGTQIASTPFVDANLVFVGNTLVYTEWPQYTLSQLPMPGSTPARRDDLRMLGMPAIDASPGGLGRVPANLGPAGELRLVTWPSGGWYHAHTTPDANGLLTVTGLTHTATLGNQPGGFAYVPQGSPGFAAQSVIVAEWSGSDTDKVAVYEVDAQGDPVVATRQDFFAQFPRPWGAYFEPLTGDYLFLSWTAGGADRVYVVQGFVPPVLL